MNDMQSSLFERAVQEEPDIHKNAVLLHSWAARLSCHGSEVTPAQLKNWLNNRKAKLARTAVKDGRLSSEDSLTGDKQDMYTTHVSSNLPECLPEDDSFHAEGQNQIPTSKKGEKTCVGSNISKNVEIAHPEWSTQLNPRNLEVPKSNSNGAWLAVGQEVLLIDTEGKEMAKGTVFQVEGEWQGCNLAETSTCVVDITELKSDRIVRLPDSYVSDATFQQAEVQVGSLKVLWKFTQIRVR